MSAQKGYSNPIRRFQSADYRELFRVINRYVGNLPPMPGVFPDYPARRSSATLIPAPRW
jgi:hypothetical protein